MDSITLIERRGLEPLTIKPTTRTVEPLKVILQTEHGPVETVCPPTPRVTNERFFPQPVDT